MFVRLYTMYAAAHDVVVAISIRRLWSRLLFVMKVIVIVYTWMPEPLLDGDAAAVVFRSGTVAHPVVVLGGLYRGGAGVDNTVGLL